MDWTPYFGDYTVSGLVLAAATGAFGLAPIVVLALGNRLAFQLISRIVRFVS
jgi:hypothetical protein